MDYQEAIDFLYNSRMMGTKLGLLNISYLLEKLGNPHRKFKSIHIAGTNGKGSTAAMIASALTAAGYRTGLYTSPHLISFRERVRVDGALITPEEVIAGVERIRPIAGQFPGLTFFEVWTGLAFDYFIRKKKVIQSLNKFQ